jgi:predicted SnoaL-like aldol condensation-catalyzing enzyme
MQSQAEKHIKLVKKFYFTLYSKKSEKMIDFLSDEYVEHQQSADFTKQGLINYATARSNINPDYNLTIERIIAQNNLVFLHVVEKISSEIFIRGELFRLENEKIIEHWSAEQKHPQQTKSGRSLYDGAKVNYSSNNGKKFAVQSRDSYLNAFLQTDRQKINSIIRSSTSDKYLQHNPALNDGIETYLKAMKTMQAFRIFGIKPTRVVFSVIAEGDFVVLFGYCRIPFLFGNAIVFDILRIRDDGKKDEHWDVIEKCSKTTVNKIFGTDSL